jgi:organic radical activating enzyme
LIEKIDYKFKEFNRVLQIEWTLGNTCNYNCSYCLPILHNNSFPWINLDESKTFIDKLHNHYSKLGITDYIWKFGGGEPTLYKDFAELCVYINSKPNNYIIPITNGSRKLHWWQEHAKNFFAVHFSIHPEFVDPNHIVAVCDNLIEQKIDDALTPALTDNMWRVPAQILANNLVTDVNRSLQSEGLRVDPLTASVQREFPDRVKTIVEECRLAEHVLIDMMDGGRYEQLFDPTHNAQRIIELQKDPNHAFLDEGDLTVFVNGVTQPHSPRGRTFLDILVHKVKSAHPDVAMIKHFTATYAGPTTYAFIEAYLTDIATNSNVPEWNLSVDVIRNNF